MTQVVTFGETLVGFRTDGPLHLPAALQADVRGAESNVAIGLARLGHAVRWVSRVSTDAYGEAVLRTLRAEGVDVSAVVRDEAPTGLMLIQQRTADLATVDYRRAGSAASRLRTGDLTWDETPAVLHVTGITLALSESCREAAYDAVVRAHSQGATVVLDVNHRARLWSREEASATLRPLLSHVDVVVASTDELPLVCDGEPEELFRYGIGEVVVKHGAAGSTSHTDDGRVDAAAIPVTAVDPIGAGDAFCAGWISALLDGEDVPGRLRRGNVCGAFAVSTYGDTAGLPRRDELALLDATDTTLR